MLSRINNYDWWPKPCRREFNWSPLSFLLRLKSQADQNKLTTEREKFRRRLELHHSSNEKRKKALESIYDKIKTGLSKGLAEANVDSGKLFWAASESLKKDLWSEEERGAFLDLACDDFAKAVEKGVKPQAPEFVLYSGLIKSAIDYAPDSFLIFVSDPPRHTPGLEEFLDFCASEPSYFGLEYIKRTLSILDEEVPEDYFTEARGDCFIKNFFTLSKGKDRNKILEHIQKKLKSFSKSNEDRSKHFYFYFALLTEMFTNPKFSKRVSPELVRTMTQTLNHYAKYLAGFDNKAKASKEFMGSLRSIECLVKSKKAEGQMEFMRAFQQGLKFFIRSACLDDSGCFYVDRAKQALTTLRALDYNDAQNFLITLMNQDGETGLFLHDDFREVLIDFLYDSQDLMLKLARELESRNNQCPEYILEIFYNYPWENCSSTEPRLCLLKKILTSPLVEDYSEFCGLLGKYSEGGLHIEHFVGACCVAMSIADDDEAQVIEQKLLQYLNKNPLETDSIIRNSDLPPIVEFVDRYSETIYLNDDEQE